MARVLHLPAVGARRLAARLQARSRALAALDGPGVTLAASNQVWADPTLTTLRGYLNAVATGYNAGVDKAPFSTDPQLAAKEINQAISAATRGHIPKLVTPDMLVDVGWVLTSALYMNAKWATPFTAEKTAKRAVHPGRSAAGQRAVHGGRRLPLRHGRRMDRGLAPLPGRQAGDDRAAAAVGFRVLRAAGHDHPARDRRRARHARPGRPGGPHGQSPDPAAQGQPEHHGQYRRHERRAQRAWHEPGVRSFRGLLRAIAAGVLHRLRTAGGHAPCRREGHRRQARRPPSASPRTGGEFNPHTVVFNRPYLMLVTATSTGEPLFLAKVANPAAA